MRKYVEGISSFEVQSREFSGLSAQVPFCWQHTRHNIIASATKSYRILSIIANRPLWHHVQVATLYPGGIYPYQKWLTPRCLIVQTFSYSSLLYIAVTNRNARLLFCAFHVVLCLTSLLEQYGFAQRQWSTKRRTEFFNFVSIVCAVN